MKLEHARTPWWLRWGVPFATWRKRTGGDHVFLTFDDSPSPFTDTILDCLESFDVLATFFCVGKNVIKYPEQMNRIHESGHAVGNHSFSHANGWQTPLNDYVEDVAKCDRELSRILGRQPRCFRPPYGRMTLRQMLKIRKQYEIVMWDVMSMDYRKELDADDVASNVIRNVRRGSIVLLHDSEIASARILEALPKILTELKKAGFRFSTLDHC